MARGTFHYGTDTTEINRLDFILKYRNNLAHREYHGASSFSRSSDEMIVLFQACFQSLGYHSRNINIPTGRIMAVQQSFKNIIDQLSGIFRLGVYAQRLMLWRAKILRNMTPELQKNIIRGLFEYFSSNLENTHVRNIVLDALATRLHGYDVLKAFNL